MTNVGEYLSIMFSTMSSGDSRCRRCAFVLVPASAGVAVVVVVVEPPGGPAQ